MTGQVTADPIFNFHINIAIPGAQLAPGKIEYLTDGERKSTANVIVNRVRSFIRSERDVSDPMRSDLESVATNLHLSGGGLEDVAWAMDELNEHLKSWRVRVV